jgi:glycosyltransferase involved in cell wall biosynthesis
MTVSVIITVYNLEGFVARAIESALNQTIKPDEIIVVDDGSKDDSVKVIESFGDRVKLVRMEKNSGVLPSFLAGIKQSKGDILSFLDGDDIWMPNKLEKVLAVFQQHEDAMMVTHLHRWIDKDDVPTNVVDATHLNLKRIVDTAANTDQMDALLKNSILCYKGVWLGSAFCVRRRHFDIADYETWVSSLPGKELSHQDQPLAAYLILKNPEKKIYFINEALFLYRVYPTNSSGSTVNLESAIKTLNRSIATVSRTRDIVQRNKRWKEENFMQEMKLTELQFYKDLYQKKNAKALKAYVRLFSSYWDRQRRIKETKRFVACAILGPTKFLQTKTKKRFG